MRVNVCSRVDEYELTATEDWPTIACVTTVCLQLQIAQIA